MLPPRTLSLHVATFQFFFFFLFEKVFHDLSKPRSPFSSPTQQSKPPIGVYELKYLGAVRVKDEVGNEVVRKAVNDLRIRFHQILELSPGDDWTVVGDRVVLVLTSEGIR